MKTRLRHTSASIGFIVLLLASTAAAGAELTFFSAVGIQEVMEDLAPKFERASGNKVVVTFATSKRGHRGYPMNKHDTN